ncbi:15390_t:CDS:2, partial [Racocetra persica]
NMTDIKKQLEKLNNIRKKLEEYKNKVEEYRAEAVNLVPLFSHAYDLATSKTNEGIEERELTIHQNLLKAAEEKYQELQQELQDQIQALEASNKCRMTQILSEEGLLIPVTPIWIGDNVISQVKTETKEGYNACQIAFGDCTEKNLNKPKLGHLKKNNVSPKKHLREIRNMTGFVVGSPIDLSHFEVGDEVD